MTDTTKPANLGHLIKVLICGEPATGKTTSFAKIRNPERVLYLTMEANKDLPFKAKFKRPTVGITDPRDVLNYARAAMADPEIDTIIIDGVNAIFEAFELKYINGVADTRAAWGDYGTFVQELMQDLQSGATKHLIYTGHLKKTLDKDTGLYDYALPVKGAQGIAGIERMFTHVLYSRCIPFADLARYGEPDETLLNPNDWENGRKLKYVFQLQPTADNPNSKIRGAFGMWALNQIYMDNDVQLYIDKVQEYYAS